MCVCVCERLLQRLCVEPKMQDCSLVLMSVGEKEHKTLYNLAKMTKLYLQILVSSDRV